MISSNHNVLPLVPKHPVAPEQDHPLEEYRAALRPTSDQPRVARSVVAPDNNHQEHYLQGLGWTLPRNWQETVQLTHKIANPLPEQPVKRDFWGFLTRPVPLTQTQQDQVRAVVREWAGSDQRSLFAQLGKAPSPPTARPHLASSWNN